MKRIIYTIFLGIIILVIFSNIKMTSSKYIIKTECKPKVVISLDNIAPEITITDINGKNINSLDNQAIGKAKISYLDEISGVASATYKYNPDEEEFENIGGKQLDNDKIFSQKGWYEIEAIDNAKNITIFHFYLCSAVCKIEESYFDSITSAVESIASNSDKSVEIVMLTNTGEDVSINENRKVLLNINNHEITGTFTIEELSALYTKNGDIKSITNNPVFKVYGNLEIINGEYTAEKANILEVSGGTCEIEDGELSQISSGYYYTVLVTSNGKLNIKGNATVTGNYMGIRTERESITKITNGTINTNICAAAVYSDSTLEVSGNALLNCNGSSATVTSMANLIISGGTIKQSGTGSTIDIQRGTTKISDEAKIISSGTNVVHVASRADVRITGGEIINIGEGNALVVNNKSSSTCIVKISGSVNIVSKGEYTVYSEYGTQTIEITGGTITNTNSSGYAIYVKSGTIEVQGAIINGKTFH